MILLEQGQYFKSIKEELDSISIINSGSMMNNLPVIENIETFSKTQVYHSLRKGQLSDEELSFIISNYNYSNSQLNELILSKVKDLTITKAISIGAISKALEVRVGSYYDRSNFEYDLRAFIKVKDYELELIELIKFFNYRKTSKINESCDRKVFESFLKSFWYNGSTPYSTADLVEKEAAVKAIKNHYKDIYELLQDPLRVKSKNKRSFNTKIGRAHV